MTKGEFVKLSSLLKQCLLAIKSPCEESKSLFRAANAPPIGARQQNYDLLAVTTLPITYYFHLEVATIARMSIHSFLLSTPLYSHTVNTFLGFPPYLISCTLVPASLLLCFFLLVLFTHIRLSIHVQCASMELTLSRS